MKKVLAIIAYVSVTCTTSFAQPLNEFFNNKNSKIVWLGVDFSETRLYGDAKMTNDQSEKAADILDYFKKINLLLLEEPNKYRIDNAFKKLNVTANFSAVTQVNNRLNPDLIISFNPSDYSRLNKQMIQDMVQNYETYEDSGYGVVFIMECLNKQKKLASMWVTIIDLSNNSVLLTDRIVGKPSGFGFRNYWARTILDVLVDIRVNQYDKWKRKNKKNKLAN